MQNCLIFFLLAGIGLCADSYVLRPAVGSGTKGDGGPATAALLDGPFGLAEDKSGNIYISESNAGVIRRVKPDGTIERSAGTGLLSDGVAGGSALATDLISPSALAIDRNNNLVFADAKACRIRILRADGTIADLAGTGRCAGASAGGFPGPGGGGRSATTGPALQIDIAAVSGLAVDSSSRILFSEETMHLVRRLDADGVVRIVAGVGTPGYYGDSGPATGAALSSPRGLAFDNNGNLYIADGENCRIRAVDSSGVITTLLSTGSCTASPAARVTGLAYDELNDALIYALPSARQVIRASVSTLVTTIVAGNGRVGAADNNLAEPRGVLVSQGRVLVADNTAFRVVSAQGGATAVFAGGWPQLESYGAASSAPLLRPMGLCLTPAASLIVVDAGAERVLSLSSSGELTAIAGVRYPTGFNGGVGGPAVSAQIANPRRVACGPDGRIYLALRDRIRMIDTQGVMHAYIDFFRVTTTTMTNGTTTSATSVAAPSSPVGMAVDSAGRLIIAESGMNRVLRWDPTNQTTTLIAGTGTAGFAGDGGAGTDAKLDSPGDVAFDSKGNLLIADRGNGRVRKLSSDGKISTIAGSGLGFSYVDLTGQIATSVGFGSIEGMAVDTKDNIYIAEARESASLVPTPAFQILAGLVQEDDSGKQTYRIQELNAIDDIAVDARGRIYFALRQNGQVMMLADAIDLGPAPAIAAGGVVRSLQFGGGATIAPNTWIEIYGSALSGTTRSWTGSDFQGSQAPTKLDETSVSIGGQAAFVAYVSPNQVNVLVPSDVAPGAQQLTVSTGVGISAPYSVDVESVQPGIFSMAKYAGGLLAGGQFAMPADTVAGVVSRPARPGEGITFYGTGFGSVIPRVRAGVIAPQATSTDLPFSVLFGQTRAAVNYAGLSPGSVGLYQFNVTVPAGISGDAVPLTFSLGGNAIAQPLAVAVQP
ncbi:MAG: hypothetical protein ABJF23_26635 [Bryobacteraceae bacterium]